MKKKIWIVIVIVFVPLCDFLYGMKEKKAEKQAGETWSEFYKRTAKDLPEIKESEEKSVYMPEFVSRGLLICLDDSEIISGPVVERFMVMLTGRHPILVSNSVVAKAFQCIDEELIKKLGLNKTLEELIRIYNASGFAAKQSDEQTQQEKCILFKAVRFEKDKWIVKKVNESLSLFIPHAYLQKEKIDIEAAKKRVTDKEVTEAELKLGLKINHMDTVEVENIKRKIREPLDSYFVDFLENIFCTRSDYRNKINLHPNWTIYMVGHGIMKYDVVGISLEKFRIVLDFLEQKINTKLLMYTSCYAGGRNIEILYKDAKTGIQRTYSFPIIVEAIGDAPAIAAPQRLFINQKYQYLQLESFAVFSRFVDKVERTSITAESYLDLIRDIVATDIRNQPQIKLPGLEWFSVVDIGKKIASIGSALAQSRDVDKALNINNFFKNPQVILLYTNDVPFELVIEDNITDIISMVPGNVLHKIKSISSMNSSLYISSLFKFLEHVVSQKIFFIGEVRGKYEQLKNVFVYKQGEKVAVLYTKDNECFVRDGLIRKPCKDEDKKKYNSLLDKVHFFDEHSKGLLFQTDVYHRQRVWNLLWNEADDMIVPIGTSIIDKIICNKYGPVLGSIASVIDLLQDKLMENSRLWVKEITGEAGSPHPSTISASDAVTYDDVIVLKDEYYFTYNKKFYHVPKGGELQEIQDNYIKKYENILTQEVTTQKKIKDVEEVEKKKQIKQKREELRELAGYQLSKDFTIYEQIIAQLGKDIKNKVIAVEKLSDELINYYWGIFINVKKNEPIKGLRLSYSAIQKIILPRGSLFIDHIIVKKIKDVDSIDTVVYGLQKKLQNGSQLLIKKLTGQQVFGGFPFPKEQEETLKNVIILKDKYYFTYDNTFYLGSDIDKFDKIERDYMQDYKNVQWEFLTKKDLG